MKTKAKAIDHSSPLLALEANRRIPARIPLEREGIESLCGRIRAGETMRKISSSLNIDVAALHRYLRAPENTLATDMALRDSAEALLDCGLQTLIDAAGKDNAEVTRAKAIAQEYARRAAIRNPRYSDRQNVELSGPDGGPITSQAAVVVYVPHNGRDGNIVESE
jgi:hypothetical protein